MTKTVEIDGREYRMRASALTPRLYRAYFRRDMIRDMQKLLTAYNQLISLPEDAPQEEKDAANLEILDSLEVFVWVENQEVTSVPKNRGGLR